VHARASDDQRGVAQEEQPLMPSKPAIIRFKAPLEKMSGSFGWTYVEFPHDVAEMFGTKGRVRVKGTINGVPMDRALLPTKSGYHVIILGGDLRKQAKLKLGQPADVEVWVNTKPDEIELPEELAETLAFLPDFKRAWEAMRPGMKRSVVIWITQGKTVATRAKRVAELLRRSESGHSWFGRKR
jgi:hypothetical protein